MTVTVYHPAIEVEKTPAKWCYHEGDRVYYTFNITNIGDVLTAKGIVKRKYEDENGKFISCKVHVEDQNGEVKVSGKTIIKFN